ncbi:hypothetical protein K3148_08950 [Qipengyuania aurantiaca]|uniref:C-type cytochrome biogenesis protein CcmI n=1 Tax=Qipengyuania aurantiaca TaxID=2867233 RepID=A0ABX8ZIZ1_9SPHN|nr:hypothetical protein [Qipengyuania aurantiaca]QZD88975.1 hypothetical protein K3148_08950 [Qipengyuania aurantiaca]
MSSWAVVAIIAIVVWGVVQMAKARNRAERGVLTDKEGNEHYAPQARDAETKKEIEALRERIKVLERIATDGNSLDAQETKRISAEIEALRDKQAD